MFAAIDQTKMIAGCFWDHLCMNPLSEYPGYTLYLEISGLLLGSLMPDTLYKYPTYTRYCTSMSLSIKNNHNFDWRWIIAWHCTVVWCDSNDKYMFFTYWSVADCGWHKEYIEKKMLPIHPSRYPCIGWTPSKGLFAHLSVNLGQI